MVAWTCAVSLACDPVHHATQLQVVVGLALQQMEQLDSPVGEVATQLKQDQLLSISGGRHLHHIITGRKTWQLTGKLPFMPAAAACPLGIGYTA